MENLSMILCISMIVPLSMLIPVFIGRTRSNVMFLLIGILTCFFCGELNGLLIKLLEETSVKNYTVNVSPIIEELAKAYPLFIYGFLVRADIQEMKERSLALGVGFAILENAYVLANNSDTVSIGLALIRGFGAGMMHGICSLIVGCGIGAICKYGKLKITGSVAVMCVAISYHSIYNDFVQSTYNIIGFILPILTFVPMLIILGRRGKAKPTEIKEV